MNTSTFKTHINAVEQRANTIKRRNVKHQQRGFGLVEVMVAMAVVLILAIIAVPRVNGMIISNKTPALGTDLQKFVAVTSAAAQGAGATPYTGIGGAQLASSMRTHSSNVTVTGTGAEAVVTHAIGATDGTVTVAPATITTAGDAFAITVAQVNEAACPQLSAVMQRVSESMTINGITVKAAGANGAPGTYSPQTAQSSCTTGNTNTFVFTAR